MARSSLPANYPQPLAGQILKSETHRQASILRQEALTDLLGLLTDAREPALRARLARLVASYLKAGVAAAARAEELWPGLKEVREVLAEKFEGKPTQARKALKVFEQMEKGHRRSLDLLQGSFASIEVILDRLGPAEAAAVKPAAPAVSGGGK